MNPVSRIHSLIFKIDASLFQKSVDDLLFRLFLRQPQRHQFNDLFSRDFTDCRFVHQRRVHIVGVQLGNRQYPGLVHDDGVAFRMTFAGRIACNAR